MLAGRSIVVSSQLFGKQSRNNPCLVPDYVVIKQHLKLFAQDELLSTDFNIKAAKSVSCTIREKTSFFFFLSQRRLQLARCLLQKVSQYFVVKVTAEGSQSDYVNL